MAAGQERQQLVLAVLASQLGFATPGQVLAAASAWLVDRGQSLTGRLEADGVLTPQQRVLLELMGQQAIEACGGSEEALRSLGGEPVLQRTFAGSLVLEPDGRVHAADRPSTLLRDEVAAAEPPPVEPSAVTREAEGRYRLEEEYGRGGQARVLLAFDNHIGRRIAWKEMLDRAGAEGVAESQRSALTARAVDRFLREARVTGQLEHPNIVPVYEVGQRADGRFFYTMRLVRGQTMGERLRACRSLAERLKLLGPFWDICNAVAFAHSRGVIHRDIKPANAMVGEFGETVLLDWGLAKVAGGEDLRGREMERQLNLLLRGDGSHTIDGAALGTPSYMSPEQAEGAIDKIDRRSDVWGLGAMLYEILTGRPPHTGETPFEVVGKVIKLPVQPVGVVCPEAPAELAAVAGRALQRDPAQRYQSAQELATDVSAYMTGGRVRAHEYSGWELFVRFAIRNKAALTAAGVIFAVIVAALVMVTLSYRQEAAAREREQRERQQAEFRLAQAYVEKADRLSAAGQHPASRLFALASLLHNPAGPAGGESAAQFAAQHPAAADILVDARSAVYRADHTLTLTLQGMYQAGDILHRVTFSPDGRRLAFPSYDGKVTLWDTGPGGKAAVIEAHRGRAYSAAFSPDGATLYTSGADDRVRIWRAPDWRPDGEIVTGHAMVHGLALSPDGERLATGGEDRRIRLWRVSDRQPLGVLEGHSDTVWHLAFAPDGRRLVSGSWDKTAVVWNLDTGRAGVRFSGHRDAVYAVAFLPDGKRVASAGWDRQALVWDAASGKVERELTGAEDSLLDLAVSPDGNLLATASMDRVLRLYDLTSGRLDVAIEGHADSVTAVAFTPDGCGLVSGGYDRLARLWIIQSRRRPVSLDGHTDWVYGVAFGPRGERLVSAGWDRQLLLWNVARQQILRRFTGFSAGLYTGDFAPDGTTAVGADTEGNLRLFDTATGQLRWSRRAHPEWIYSVRYSPDSRWLVTGSRDGTARVWAVADGSQRLLMRHGVWLYRAAFSEDGRWVASAGADGAIKVWSAEDGRLERTLQGHTDWASGVTFSSDGRLLASSGKDARVVLWSWPEGARLRELRRHRQWVNEVVFSPDSKLLASASDDKTVVLWSVADGRPLLQLPASSTAVGIDFSPDGRTLAVGDHFSVKIYPLELDVLQIDPAREMARTERDTGLVLEDFHLVHQLPGSDVAAGGVSSAVLE